MTLADQAWINKPPVPPQTMRVIENPLDDPAIRALICEDLAAGQNFNKPP
jgi:hypothetical protein